MPGKLPDPKSMSQPPFQNPQFQNPQFPTTHHVLIQTTMPIAAVLMVTRVEEIPAALSQHSNSVLIDIPEVQRRLSLLAHCKASLRRGGLFGWWILKLLAIFLINQWLTAQFPDLKDHLPTTDWLKFNFERQPDNKIILRPEE